jgi:hypothetical protein
MPTGLALVVSGRFRTGAGEIPGSAFVFRRDFRSVAGRSGRSPSERPAEAMSHVFDLKDIFIAQGPDRARDLT